MLATSTYRLTPVLEGQGLPTASRRTAECQTMCSVQGSTRNATRPNIHLTRDRLLGVEAVAVALPTANGVTLARLAADGTLSHPPANTSVMLPEDGTGQAGAALGSCMLTAACRVTRAADWATTPNC
jgi:hypothetical protein